MKKLIIASLIAAPAGLGACGNTAQYMVRGTEKSIGVDGTITIAPQAEDVNLVSVDLVNLPPPERHDRNKKAFVVWLTPVDGTPIRAGRLSYDPGARSGRLKVTTPNDQVFVQVTAEADATPAKPSDFVVVSKHVVLKRGGTSEQSAM